MPFDVIEPLQSWIRSRSRLARALERTDDPPAELPMTVDLNLLTGHVVLVGYGEVGRRIGEARARRWSAPPSRPAQRVKRNPPA